LQLVAVFSFAGMRRLFYNDTELAYAYFMATLVKSHRLLLQPKEKGDKALFHLGFSASFCLLLRLLFPA